MKILLAVDDETFGAAITDFVLKHQWPEGTRFRILHIVGWTPPERELLKSRTLMEYLEYEYERARDLTDTILNRIRAALPQVEVDAEVMEGHPARRILAIATAWGADLIILGSHGRTGISELLLGSVSHAVISNAPCSVAVIQPIRAAQQNQAKQKEPVQVSLSRISSSG
jgi:nucleotide-binding universal stress UspA family protein